MTRETKLLPCPFCGGEAEYYYRIDNSKYDGWLIYPIDNWVSCGGDCGASTAMHECESDAITAWNTRRFDNHTAIANHIIEAVGASITESETITIEFSYSNQSCSRYLTITKWDDEGDYVDEFKVRVSDHADRHGADITIRIDGNVEAIYEDGEYSHCEIEDWRVEDMIDAGIDAVKKAIEG